MWLDADADSVPRFVVQWLSEVADEESIMSIQLPREDEDSCDDDSWEEVSWVVDGAEDALETGDSACATGAVPRVASNTRCGKPFDRTSGSGSFVVVDPDEKENGAGAASCSISPETNSTGAAVSISEAEDVVPFELPCDEAAVSASGRISQSEDSAGFSLEAWGAAWIAVVSSLADSVADDAAVCASALGSFTCFGGTSFSDGKVIGSKSRP